VLVFVLYFAVKVFDPAVTVKNVAWLAAIFTPEGTSKQVSSVAALVVAPLTSKSVKLTPLPFDAFALTIIKTFVPVVKVTAGPEVAKSV
jgi:hypothetical protein